MIRSLIAAALILAAAAAPAQPRGGKGGAMTYTVSRGDIDVKVQELGVVEAVRTVGISSPFSGRIVSVLESGTPVKKGDTVAQLDVAGVAEDLQKKLEELRTTKKELEGSIEELLIALRTNALDTDAAGAQLDMARVELASTNSKLGELEELYSKNIVPRDDVRSAEYELGSAQIQTFAEDMNLRGKTTGAQGQESTTRVGIERFGLRGERQLARVKELQGRVQNATIVAPVDGLFLRTQRWNWQSSRMTERQAGEELGEGEKIGSIPDLSELVVRSQIPESRLLAVKPGMPATVSFEALGGLSVPAKVSAVSPLAIPRNQSAGGQASASGEESTGEKVFEVKLSLDSSDERLKPGLTARVTILLDRIENVVSVPVSAITTRAGGHYVQVVAGEKRVERKVEVARLAGDMATISSGVEAGEVVALRTALKR